MADLIEFYVNDKLYKTDKSSLSVAEVLAKAGLSADDHCLISSDDIRYSDLKQNVEIDADGRFTTEKQDSDCKPLIFYKVNGERLSTSTSMLTVEVILRDAGKAASIDQQQLNSYYLENIGTCKKYENLTDVVEIGDDDEFLAVHSGATPVACFLLP